MVDYPLIKGIPGTVAARRLGSLRDWFVSSSGKEHWRMKRLVIKPIVIVIKVKRNRLKVHVSFCKILRSKWYFAKMCQGDGNTKEFQPQVRKS